MLDDENHSSAVEVALEISKGKYGTIVTSDYVFDEVVTLVLKKVGSLSKARLAGNYIKGSAQILTVDEGVFDDAWNLFGNQKSSRLSFTDCTTAILMHNKWIRHIATFDKEFKDINRHFRLLRPITVVT